MSDQNTSGRIRVSLRKAKPDQEPARREEIPRIVRLLALAHRWHRLVDEGTVESQTEIARMTGLTRARVTQIMDLRWLSPWVQAQLVATRCRLPRTDEREFRVATTRKSWSTAHR